LGLDRALNDIFHNFCAFHWAGLASSKVTNQWNITLFPSWHFREVINDLLGAKVFVLKDTLLEIVSWQDDWNIIDKKHVVSINHNVINLRTVNQLGLLHISRLLPFSIVHNRMSSSNFKSTVKVADVLSSVRDMEAQEASDLCIALLAIIESLNPVTFLNVLDQLY